MVDKNDLIVQQTLTVEMKYGTFTESNKILRDHLIFLTTRVLHSTKGKFQN